MDYYSLTNWVVLVYLLNVLFCFVFTKNSRKFLRYISGTASEKSGHRLYASYYLSSGNKEKNTFLKKMGMECARTLNLRAWNSG